MSRV
ncbi:hypothetical protein MTR67_012797 [Solanum verrucosum]|jgi:import inner membrane translocase subunit TIM17